MSENEKNILVVALVLLYKALKLILGSKIILNDKNWISKVMRIFHF